MKDYAARLHNKGERFHAALRALKEAPGTPDELDIIRGRIPTPPGYTVDPLRVKKLMRELRQSN